jgi:hypothetical protein
LGQVAIEYMIMIPVLILQIFLFPIVASAVMGGWTDSRMNLQLQDVAENLGSSIQQLYYSVNHATISNGSFTCKLNIPTYISDNQKNYNYTITLGNGTNPTGSAKIINLTLKIVGTNVATSRLVTLGDNIGWQSNLTTNRFLISTINITKTPSGSIWLSFIGGT